MTLRRLAAGFLVAGAMLAAACGGEGGGSGDNPDFEQDPGATSPSGPQPTSVTRALEPVITGSNPSQFSIIESDLGGQWTTDDDHTFVRGPQEYQAFGFFDTPEEAQAQLAEWQYQGGYVTGFDPVGLTAAVLRGSFYIDLEIHLWGDIEKAKAAFDHFVDYRGSAEGAEMIDLPGYGNEHAALKLTSGTVTGTDIPAVYHLYIFRRGNMVTVIQTRGGEPYMTDDAVAQLAAIVDEKVLGTRATASPTPGDLVPVPATITATP